MTEMTKEVKLLNIHQVMFYVEQGVQPIRLENGRDNTLVFVFSKEDVYGLFPIWQKMRDEYKESLYR